LPRTLGLLSRPAVFFFEAGHVYFVFVQERHQVYFFDNGFGSLLLLPPSCDAAEKVDLVARDGDTLA